LSQADCFFDEMAAAGDSSQQFASSENFLEILKQEENENKKQFAENNLTFLNSTSSNGSSSSSGNSGSGDSNTSKWWTNLNAQQPSKLELSNVSCLSTSELVVNEREPVEPTKMEAHQKKKVSVESFFDKKSELDPFLQVAKSDVNIEAISNNNATTAAATMPIAVVTTSAKRSNEQDHDKTLCEEHDQTVTKIEATEPNLPMNTTITMTTKMATRTASNRNSVAAADDEITFSTSLNQTPLSASNFSFTFNTSESGDFIQKKPLDKKTTANSSNSPYQLTKQISLLSMSNKSVTGGSKKSDDLKKIDDELDRLADRVTASKKKTSSKG
jgi:hypothetical protein